MFELVLNEAHHQRVIKDLIPECQKFLWIVTADIKDLHTAGTGKRFIPFLSILADLVRSGIDVRLIHSKEPGPRFRKDFDRYPELVESDRFERVLCPRMHTKAFIIDGRKAYIGSANLTGAGIGAKSQYRRNFETGIITDDPEIVSPLVEEIDRFYIGDYCPKCQRRNVCPDPIE